MSQKTTIILLTVVIAIAAFLVGPVLWPMADHGSAPTGAQLPFFILVSALEALAFGFGIAFLIYGWKWMKPVADQSRKVALVIYLCAAWLLVSWWPHDNMHIAHDMADWWGLIRIEYMFHVTLIIAGAGLAWAFTKVVRMMPARTVTQVA
jgi:hypothetical protein